MFITCFGHFDVCFYLVGHIQVERSKNEQRVVKRSQNKQDWANHESMPRHGCMRSFSQKPEAGMPHHAQFMPQHAKAVQKQDFQVMPQHAQIMLRHDLKIWFLTLPWHAAAWIGHAAACQPRVFDWISSCCGMRKPCRGMLSYFAHFCFL